MQPLPAVRSVRIRKREDGVRLMNVSVNGIKVEVAEGTTILEAARAAGFEIPTLCYRKDLNVVGACRLCVVEVKGCDRLVSACNTPVSEGMEIETRSERVRETRRQNLRLILSRHDARCLVCVRNGTCELQRLARDAGFWDDDPHPRRLRSESWDASSPIVRDAARCVSCLRCASVCEKELGRSVWELLGAGATARVGVRDGLSLKEAGCTFCGKCVDSCPVGCLSR